MSDAPRHCTDPAIHGPHTYADDADMRGCPGSSLHERIADALRAHDIEFSDAGAYYCSCGEWFELDKADLDGHLAQVAAGVAETELTRVRAALVAELDDMDPDHTMRDGHTDDTGDQGHPGNAWWRAYCEVGGMMRALAVIDNVRSSSE